MNVFADFLSRAAPLVASIGAVQFVIFLLKRRSELKALDTATAKAAAEADAIVVDSAAKSLVLSDQVRDNAIRRAEEAMIRADALVVELGQQIAKTREVTARLARVEGEVVALKAKIARLEAAGV